MDTPELEQVKLIGELTSLVGDLSHDVIFKPPRQRDGYKIVQFNFLSELKDRGSGCVFIIEPNKATRVVHVVDDEEVFSDIPISGRGHFLAIDSDKEVHYQYFDLDKNSKPEGVEYKKGWTIVWIAADTEFKVLQKCTPHPFDPKFEVGVDKDSIGAHNISIPSEFLTKYQELTTEQLLI